MPRSVLNDHVSHRNVVCQGRWSLATGMAGFTVTAVLVSIVSSEDKPVGQTM